MNRKIISIVCFIFFIPLLVKAQRMEAFAEKHIAKFPASKILLSETTFAKPQMRYNSNTYEHWRRLKISGILLTSFGAACSGIGAVMAIRGAARERESAANGQYRKDADMGKVMGLAGVYGGLTAIAGGLPMWIIGHHKLKKLEKLSIKILPGETGLVYRF